jgi:hypothetical protein
MICVNSHSNVKLRRRSESGLNRDRGRKTMFGLHALARHFGPVHTRLVAASGENLTLGARLESDGNSGSHAPDSHASSQMGIPSGIQMSDAIH